MARLEQQADVADARNELLREINATLGLRLAALALPRCASMLIAYVPFVILEGAWAPVTAVGLARSYAGAQSKRDVTNSGTSCRG